MSSTSRFRIAILHGCLHLGRRLGQASSHRVSVAHSFVELGAWSREVGPLPTDYAHREDLFAIAASRLETTTRPLYLEFGVYQGSSLRWWIDRVRHPGARFVGFDSFEGLPEKWNRYFDEGDFGATEIPRIDDSRVSLEVGWFDQTVPDFVVPDHDGLLVNVDSDLYSSAALVLKHVSASLTPGTMIYFDEFSDRDHELRAFREYLERTGKRVRPLGTADNRNCWLFEFVDQRP